jgi:uncharacterized repeat protein (TIGR04076 family)
MITIYRDRIVVKSLLGDFCRFAEIAQVRDKALERGDAAMNEREQRATDPAAEQSTFALYDLRVTVVAIEGRSVCGLAVGDYFEVTESSRVRIPPGKHFCLYALSAVLPLLPAKQRALADADWLARDNLVACPDPEERLIMRIERIARRELRSDDLT